MFGKKLTRRDFLRGSAMVAVGAAAASCAQPTPLIVEKEVPVEKVVKETVVVSKEVAVEKVVTATPVVMKYGESPQLAGKVQQGQLPPVDERLPETPLVIEVWEEIGQYGGTWHRLSTSAGDAMLITSRLSYENLVRFTPDGGGMIPNICTSWEISPDGKVFTFKLRKGMKWSDGEPYTATDLVYPCEVTWKDKEQTPNFPSTWSPGGTPMVVEAVDDYTARLTFGAPYGLCMVKLASADGSWMAQAPEHYMKQFHVKYTDKAKLEAAAKAAGFEFWYQYYGNRNNYQNNLDKPVIYAWKPTVLPPKIPVVYERNPYYWKVDPEGNQLPYIDRIEFVIVESAAVINVRAASGEVDMQFRHITFDNYPIFQDSKEKGDYRVLLWKQGLASDACLALNQTNKDEVLRAIVQDKRFRYALSLGMNRDEIIQAVYLGMAEPSQISPLPTSAHYWEEYAKWKIEYDPAQANALLDEMGLKDKDADGYRLRPDGKRLTIIFEYAPVFGAWGNIGELLSAQWKQIGVDLQTKEENRELMYERKLANEHDMGVWTGSAEFNPLIDPRWFLPFSTESHHFVQYAQWWSTQGKEGIEPTGDVLKTLELYDEIKVTVDEEKQKALFRQILELNKENLWLLGVATAPPQVCIVKNNFRNVPEELVVDWHLLSPANSRVEQYFIKQS